MKNKTNLSISFWLFFFLLLIIFFNYWTQHANSQMPKKMVYSEFIENVKKGEVKAVSIAKKEDGISEVEGVLNDNSKFTLSAPSDDPVLFQVLHTAGVKIIAKLPGTTGGRILQGFFLYWGPIILLIVFWIFMMNRSQSGAGGAMAFGKSRAKLAAVGGKITFADVAGVDEAKEELQEIIQFLKEPKKFQTLGGKIPKGVLLLGPPGTGKTLLARAVAGEAGVPFFSISGSDFGEMFVGVGAARVRDLFEQGKRNAPCIIFIDEIDAVGRHRGAGLGGGHDEREQTLNALLVEMDGFESNTGVIIIAATNRPDVLDPALLRPGRFDRQVTVNRPDIKGREGILKVHSKNVKLEEGTDMSIIAKRTSGFSGADLANLVNEAALLAARRNKKAVGMEDLEESIERIVAGPEKKTRISSEKENRNTAYHEAGHAIVTRFLPGTDPVHKISIIPRGMAMGYTLSLPVEDKHSYTRTELTNIITIMMGGRAAEEVVFTDFTTGAANDIERATAIAHRMVCELGMSAKLGPLAWGKSNQEVFIGRDFMREKNYSEDTSRKIDAEIKNLVDSAHETAMSILLKNRKFLDRLAAKLLEKETIESEEFEKMYQEHAGNGKKKKAV
ncbi:MAG: ATP-dependent zinc metalloprotease FtsH [Spirochaetia bacterium]|nr:ATP-dependent zinc metalloprotease FtsH [Spirochaetia bacterium]